MGTSPCQYGELDMSMARLNPSAGSEWLSRGVCVYGGGGRRENERQKRKVEQGERPVRGTQGWGGGEREKRERETYRQADIHTERQRDKLTGKERQRLADKH